MDQLAIHNRHTNRRVFWWAAGISVFGGVISIFIKPEYAVTTVFVVLIWMGAIIVELWLRLNDIDIGRILGHYSTIEEKIMVALRLALGSREIATAISSSVVRPLSERFVDNELCSDQNISDIIIRNIKSFGESLSDTNGVSVANYTDTMNFLMSRSKSVCVTSLVPPKIWGKMPLFSSYVNDQKVMVDKGMEIERTFVFSKEDHFSNEDWASVQAMHDGKIALNKVKNKYILSGADLYQDFAVFDGKYVLVSKFVTDFMLGARDMHIDEVCDLFEKLYRPSYPGLFIYDQLRVGKYISIYNDLKANSC